jgi:phenylpropionate dioxygenase-like ring-hydroxylating dioxygenase large terminal subunit
MKFLRQAWYAAAWSEEVGKALLGRTILREPVVLFRDRDGLAAAIGGTCPHRFAPLARGKLSEGGISCPYHGLTFDRSGRCVRNPHGDHRIPKDAIVKSFPIAEKDTVIWIWMGDPARADAGQIPDFAPLNDEVTYTRTAGQVLDMPLRWDLMLDNLLDLSHAGFLHLGNLGSEAFSRGRMQVEKQGNRLWVNNLYPNGLPAPVFIGTGAIAPDVYVDYWVNVRWDPPGFMYFDAGITPAGHNRSEGVQLNSVQLLTPETPTSTHYFWRLFRSYRLQDASLTAAIEQMVSHAFHTEDEPMIAAVQERMGDRELMDMQPVMLGVDGGAMRARRILEDLIRKEDEPATTAAA